MRIDPIRVAVAILFPVVLTGLAVACSSDPDPAPTTADAAAASDAATSTPDASPAASVAACTGKAFTASCQSKDLCFDMYGTDTTTANKACPTQVGTFQTTPCVSAGNIGSCERTGTPTPTACGVYLYYPPTYKADSTKTNCTAPATYHAP